MIILNTVNIVIVITIIITIILNTTRSRWKQEGALEGGDGRLGGEGAEGGGCRQQVGYSFTNITFEI